MKRPHPRSAARPGALAPLLTPLLLAALLLAALLPAWGARLAPALIGGDLTGSLPAGAPATVGPPAPRAPAGQTPGAAPRDSAPALIEAIQPPLAAPQVADRLPGAELWAASRPASGAPQVADRPPGAGPQGASQPPLGAQVPAARAPVAVPQPSAQALRRFRTGNVWWLVEALWGLAVPAAWLFSGLSARLRSWAQGVGRHWLPALLLYFAAYALAGFAVDLPLGFYLGFVREHAYGLSDQTLAKWLADAAKGLALGIAGGAALIWLPYLLLRCSPRRWWLYAGLATVPLLLLMLLVGPLWIDPLFNRFRPLADRVLEGEIAQEAARGGIAGSRIFEVDKSADTRALNAYVDGSLGTQRIVLWDTLLARMERREVLFVVGHEMGHYVLGHGYQEIAFFSLLALAALYGVHRSAGGMLARWSGRFGFATLADFASLPLLELLLGVFLLLLSPLALGFSRHLEHEADRFGLELTRDNRAAATALVKLQQANLEVPRPGPLYVLWRSSHPPLADRIDFCNTYRPWDRGEPLRYGDLLHGAPPPEAPR